MVPALALKSKVSYLLSGLRKHEGSSRFWLQIYMILNCGPSILTRHTSRFQITSLAFSSAKNTYI